MAAALALSLAAAGCGTRQPARTAAEPPPVSVQVVRVEGSAAAAPLIWGGHVKAAQEVTLVARVAGRVTALPAAQGSRVRQGAPVVLFAAPEARAALRAAQAGLRAADLRADVARRQAARLDTLLAAGVATRHEHELAHEAARAAEAALDAARATLDDMSQNLALTAPLDGIVVRHLVDPGASVSPGQPLLTLHSAAAGEVVVGVPESEVPRLASGAWEVQVGDGPWQLGILDRVEGATDPATRSRLAFVRAAGGASWPSGSFARVRLRPAPAASAAGTAGPETAVSSPGLSRGAPRIPASAIVTRGELSGVYVVEDGRAYLRWVRVGDSEESGVRVLAGLAAGDRIVLHPAGLRDGGRVTIRP